MQKEYEKMQEKLKDVIPIENTIKIAREISNIHNLIKNNGKNFESKRKQCYMIRVMIVSKENKVKINRLFIWKNLKK